MGKEHYREAVVVRNPAVYLRASAPINTLSFRWFPSLRFLIFKADKRIKDDVSYIAKGLNVLRKITIELTK